MSSNTTVPKTRRDYWLPKFDENARRDARNIERIRAMGWRVVVIWECETRDEATLRNHLEETFKLATHNRPAPGQ